jgi:hypothetical protein
MAFLLLLQFLQVVVEAIEPLFPNLPILFGSVHLFQRTGGIVPAVAPPVDAASTDK